MRFRSLVTAVMLVSVLVTAAHADDGAGRPDEMVIAKPNFGGDSSPIRPGAEMPGCTLNFVFYNPSLKNPPAYIGTAGHCTNKVGQRISLDSGLDVGAVVYDSDRAGSPVDFSLIRIDHDMVSKTSPKVLGWGGPTGVAAASSLAVGDRVDMYGHGLILGSQSETRARWGVLTGWNSKEYAADMPAVNGDSGGPVLHHDTGRALGIVGRYGLGASPPSTDTGPLVSWILQALAAAGFDDLVVATAK